MRIHRAPWDSRFHTFCCKGQLAWEVQVGSVVVQWFYRKPPAVAGHGRFTVWNCNPRSYLHHAPWGVS